MVNTLSEITVLDFKKLTGVCLPGFNKQWNMFKSQDSFLLIFSAYGKHNGNGNECESPLHASGHVDAQGLCL